MANYTDLITKPTIHLNGSSGESLRDAYRKAAVAVGDAFAALAEAAPNARDYYPQGDAAFPAARGEHQQRLDRLQEVREELLALWESVQDQLDAKAR